MKTPTHFAAATEDPRNLDALMRAAETGRAPKAGSGQTGRTNIAVDEIRVRAGEMNGANLPGTQPK